MAPHEFWSYYVISNPINEVKHVKTGHLKYFKAIVTDPQNKELTTSTRPKQRICKSEWCPPPSEPPFFRANMLLGRPYCSCHRIVLAVGARQTPIHYLTGEAIRCHRLRNILFWKQQRPSQYGGCPGTPLRWPLENVRGLMKSTIDLSSGTL